MTTTYHANSEDPNMLPKMKYCYPCQSVNSQTKRAVNLFGPLETVTKNNFFFCITNAFTKYALIGAIEDKKAPHSCPGNFLLLYL